MSRRLLKIVSVEESLARERAADPLRDFFVLWDEVTRRDVQRLRQALGEARVEADMQAFLAQHPELLIQHLGGGHGRWVLPQKRLGSEHVPDFIIGEQHSGGHFWTAVELEGPQRPMFTRSGDPSRYLWHAIRQVVDWRVWLEHNRDYAARDRAQDGLGLQDISPSLPGLIVIGRRGQVAEDRRAFRRGLQRQLDIEIHSYDWLVDRVEGRIAALAHTAVQSARRTRRRGDGARPQRGTDAT